MVTGPNYAMRRPVLVDKTPESNVTGRVVGLRLSSSALRLPNRGVGICRGAGSCISSKVKVFVVPRLSFLLLYFEVKRRWLQSLSQS